MPQGRPSARRIAAQNPGHNPEPAPGRLWGYARVSTRAQDTRHQVDALVGAGVLLEHLVIEYAGGAAPRPRLAVLLQQMAPGDTVVVTRLDRMGRSVIDLGERLQQLDGRGCHFRALDQDIDTGGAMGRLVFHLLASVAEFERELIRERSRAGLQAARARGVHCGRPFALKPFEQRAAHAWRREGLTLREIAKRLHCSVSTVSRCLNSDDPIGTDHANDRKIQAQIRNAGRGDGDEVT